MKRKQKHMLFHDCKIILNCFKIRVTYEDLNNDRGHPSRGANDVVRDMFFLI